MRALTKRSLREDPETLRGPIRTCVACRQSGPWSKFKRFRVGELGSGRGAWICQGSLACFDQAARRGSFSRAFRREVSREQLELWRSELVDQGWA